MLRGKENAIPPSTASSRHASQHSSFARHRDANAGAAPTGRSFKLNERCHCGKMTCECHRMTLSPKTRRERMLSVQTPYDLTRRNKFFQSLLEEESAAREQLKKARLWELSSLYHEMEWEEAIVSLLTDEEQDRYELYYREDQLYNNALARFWNGVDAIDFEQEERLKRKSIERRHRNGMKCYYDWFAAEKDVCQCIDGEAHIRTQLINAEASNRQSTLEAFYQRCDLFHEQKHERHNLRREAMELRHKIVITEQQRFEEFEAMWKFDEEQIEAWMIERDDVFQEYLRCRSFINSEQLDEFKQLRDYAHVHRDDVLSWIQAKADERLRFTQHEMTHREELKQEAQQHFTWCLDVLEESYETAKLITESKAETRDEFYLDAVASHGNLQEYELEQRKKLMAQFAHETELRRHWIKEKVADRKLFWDWCLEELDKNVWEEETAARQRLEKKQVDEEQCVAQLMEAQYNARVEFLQEYHGSLEGLRWDESEERKALKARQLNEEHLIQQWIAQCHSDVGVFFATESHDRHQAQEEQENRRIKLVSWFKDISEAIERAEEEHQWQLTALFREAQDALHGLWREQLNEFDGIINIEGSCLELAFQRQCHREQATVIGYEERYRFDTCMLEVEEFSALTALNQDELEHRNRRLEQRFLAERSFAWREVTQAYDMLWKECAEDFSTIFAVAREEYFDAKHLEEARLREEMLARQVTMAEELRVYDELLNEEPIPEGRLSAMNYRHSVSRVVQYCRSEEEADDAVLELQRELVLSEMPALDLSEMPANLIAAFASIAEHIVEKRKAEEESIQGKQTEAKRWEKKIDKAEKEYDMYQAQKERYLQKKHVDHEKHEKRLACERENAKKMQKQVRSEELRVRTVKDNLQRLREENAQLRDSLHEQFRAAPRGRR